MDKKEFITIVKIKEEEHPFLIDIWSKSVKATHFFLKENDFKFFLSHMPEFLEAVQLYGAKDKDGNILGFLGVSDEEIEMLFIHPDSFNQGIGTILVKFAIFNLQKTKVAVNEQNKEACIFYKNLGFHLKDKSNLDSFGKPYPILNLSL